MKSRILIVVTAFTIVGACGSPMRPSKTLNVAGSWSGTSVDSQGTTVVAWAITQNGTEVSGTVTTQAPDPLDGSCNACHRNKRGTFSGTITGTVVAMHMQFDAGVDGDPTPICSATMTGSASSITDGQLTGAYTGADTCEGAFLDGTISMTRR